MYCAVIGTGVIGASWASLFLVHGHSVYAVDPAPGAAEGLRQYISSVWPFLTRPGSGREQMCCEKALSRVTFAPNLLDAEEAAKLDFVQECGPENAEFKRRLFALLDMVSNPGCILVSSSSGVPASEFIQGCANAPGRVLIGHPYNPPHVLPAVEVVPHPGTTSCTVERTLSFYRSLGKKPILVRQECPGFIGNRLQAALVHEAYSLVSRGVVSASDVDTLITESLGVRWAIQGPFVSKALTAGGAAHPDSFRKYLEVTGKASQMWSRDMALNAYQGSDAEKMALEESVSEQLRALQGVDLLRARDQGIGALLDLKTELVERGVLVG